MWSYIIRRLLLMIPTLFGVTIASFCIMQLAPGDPLLNQLGADGAQGKSGGAREAYLIQRRDLKLDKPLLLNFRRYYDYAPGLKICAYYRSRTVEEIERELPPMQQASDGELFERRQFLQTLDIDRLEDRLSDPKKHARLARAIRGYVQIYCEETGEYGVKSAIELLQDETLDPRVQIGLFECLDFMVVEAFRYTYSRDGGEEQTLAVGRVWELWWSREKDRLSPLTENRRETLQGHLDKMLAETSRSELFRMLEEDFIYDPPDMRFYAEIIAGESAETSSLEAKKIAAMVLKLYTPKPLKLLVPANADQEQVRQVRENWRAHYEVRPEQYEVGFFGSLWSVVSDTQYAHMVYRLATFNFGRSALKSREPVGDLIWSAFIVSAPLMLMAQLVIYFVSIPLGVACSVKRGTWVDHIISFKLFLLYSIPPFVAGMLLLLFFCYGDYFKWFPMERLHSDGAEQFGFFRYWLDYLWHAFLPVACLSLFSLASLAMYSRSSMLDVIGQDFIRTARAKGVPENTVTYKHALRNALIPILTLFSNFLPAMLGGSVLIEYLFNIPGMGRLGWNAIEKQDFPTLMALVYVQAIVVLLSILMTDVLYTVVDPRISFAGREETS